MALSPRDRRALIALGAVAVLAAAAWFFLLREEVPAEEEAAAPPPAEEVSPLPAPTPRQTPTATPTPTPTPTPTVSPAPSPSPGPPGASTQVGGKTVTLIDVFTEDGQLFAQVEVDGDVFTVQEGDTFADNFKLVDIDGSCATFLFGDERFTLCVEARK